MKRKKKLFFLPVILAAGLLLGACNNNTPTPPEPVVTTYTVSFDANGGTGTMEDVTGVSGEYTLPACTLTAPAGKHFAGWKVNGQGDLLQPGAKITVNAAVSLVAQWEITTYAVSFNANGGSGEMASIANVVGEYTVPESTFTAPAGKHFAGWKVNGEGEIVLPGAKINVAANVQLVAQWEVTTYTVSFAANGGSGEMADVPNIVGEYTVPACTFTAPSGKYFTGWKVGADGEVVLPEGKITVAGNVQLIAQWELIKFTVSFVANGGSGEMANVPDQLGEYSLPECTFTAPTGKHFIGWKVGGEGDLLQPAAKINVGADVRIVAQWDINVYTVTFKNGDTVLDTKQVNHGEKVTFSGEDPTKSPDANAIAYRFRGWDKSLDDPIVADTVFNADFAAYAEEIKVEDFESYEDSASLIDAGWVNLGYNNETKKWEEGAGGTVSLGSRVQDKAKDGDKSLRFDAWENGVGYKFKKSFAKGQFDHVGNALKFKLMAPSINTVKVLLFANAPVTDEDTHETEIMEVQFNYEFKPTSSEYVDYTIPLADSNWAAWGEEGKTIKLLAEAAGLKEDDIISTLTKIEVYIEGSDGGSGKPYIAFFDSLKFVTLADPQKVANEIIKPFQVYTGVSKSENVVKITLGNEGAATAKILDEAGQPEIPGTIALDGNQVTFTSTTEGLLTYVGTLTNGGQLIKGKSASGSLGGDVGAMDFNAVQVLDNFDQYTTDGQAYYQGNTDKSQRSGCRGAYYSEYYSGSGSTDWGGDGWSLLGSDGSQLKLKTDGGHSGQNYICMKNSASFGMRYMQWGLFDGSSEQNSFRGSKLSFWAKTNGKIPAFKVAAYSQTAPKNATKDNEVKSITVTAAAAAAIGSWTRFEFDLDPNRVYYGFLVFMEKNNSADSYLYLDDIEVFTASPYTELPNISIPNNTAYQAKIGGLVKANLVIKDGDKADLVAPGLGMSFTDISYTLAGATLQFTAGGVTYKGRVSQDATKVKFRSVTGPDGVVKNALTNLNFESIVLDAVDYEAEGTMYYQSNKNENNISGARGAYHCDFYQAKTSTPSLINDPNWSLMGGSGDQLQLDTTTGANGGSQSLKMKYSTAGNMRFIQWGLVKGTREGHTGFNKLGVFMKNTSANEIKVKILAFKVAKVTASNVSTRSEKEVTLPASSDWTLYSVDLDPSATYYGYGINMITKDKTGFINVDDAFFYNSYEDLNIQFFGKKDLTLSGDITAGAASLKFGANGAIYMTCANMGLDNVAGTYKMQMDGLTQQMVITIAGNTITGTYEVSALGVVTFTITAVDGPHAAYIGTGGVFTFSPAA